MKNAIIIHGKPSEEKFRNPELLNPSDSNWFPWVARQLTLNGYQVAKPDMPRPHTPVYEDWAREFRRYDITRETTLIGHSAGAGFLAKWMSKHVGVTINKLVLVAPWTDPDKNYGHFFDTQLDSKLSDRCMGGIAILHSSLDDDQANRSLEVVRTAFGDKAKYLDLPEYGHFVTGNTMQTCEFTELIKEVL